MTHPSDSPLIPAIPTRYAGCHFRSRLEARWAVAFDHLGIRWEHEPQTVMVTDHLHFADKGGVATPPWPYLPDFWLPDLELWAEVKGSLPDGETLRFLTMAASLSAQTGNDVVLLGPIPRPDRRSAWPVKFHMAEDALVYRGWALGQWDQPAMEWPIAIANTVGHVDLAAADKMVDGWGEKLTAEMVAAYTAARSARFEHGESGA